jgi:hypothetical protein
MTTGWERYYRRRELVRLVLEAAATSGRAELPWHEVPGLAAEFGSRDALLVDLARRWDTAVGGRLDLNPEGVDPAADQARAEWEVGRQQPALHRILRAHTDHPALRARARRAAGVAVEDLYAAAG